jgi:hypothetical protein
VTTPPAPSKLIIDPAALLGDLEGFLKANKVPNYVTKAILAFVIVYAAGISVAGLHAWAWSALPGTLAALGRIIIQALYGQAVHEDTVREMINNNKRAPALPGGRRLNIPDNISRNVPPTISRTTPTNGGGSIQPAAPPAPSPPAPGPAAPPPAAHP